MQDSQLRSIGRARSLRWLMIGVLVGTAFVEMSSLRSTFPAMGAAARSSWLEWCGDLLSTVSVLWALFTLIQLLGEVGRTGKFSAKASACLRGFAAAILLAAASTSLLPLIVVMTQRSMGVTPQSPVTVSGSDILLLLVGMTLLPVTSLLASAHRAQEELEQII